MGCTSHMQAIRTLGKKFCFLRFFLLRVGLAGGLRGVRAACGLGDPLAMGSPFNKLNEVLESLDPRAVVAYI